MTRLHPRELQDGWPPSAPVEVDEPQSEMVLIPGQNVLLELLELLGCAGDDGVDLEIPSRTDMGRSVELP